MTKKKNKWSVWVFIGIAILVIALFFVKANYNEINEYFNPPPKESVLTNADVQLYKFDALSNNKTANIEIWLINIGDETAINITMHIRTRSQNGTLLFEKPVILSTFVLQENETCTGDYTITYASNKSAEHHLYHTIEISWDGGRHTYSKETD